jgi:hypothetical protein
MLSFLLLIGYIYLIKIYINVQRLITCIDDNWVISVSYQFFKNSILGNYQFS